MPVDSSRLWNRLNTLAKIGETSDGGVTRISLDPNYLKASKIVIDWMKETDLIPRIDPTGNLIGRKEGSDANLPAIVIGSHIDTVINGGKFDGTVGVLGGLEVIQALKEDGHLLHHPIELVAFLEEESTRWGLSLFGSRMMVGQISSKDVLERKDRQGISLQDLTRQVGIDPFKMDQARRNPGEICCYLEMHIEQGAVLDSLGIPVGVVTGIAGPLFKSLRLKGRADHAGATPMNLRRDALVGAAQIILECQRIAKETSPTTVATVGRLEVQPGAINAIPGEVFMTFDIRDITSDTRDRLEEGISTAIKNIAVKNDLEFQIEEISRVPPVGLPSSMIDLIAQACGKVNIPVHHLPSGAGHDAQALASITDVGMIFVRCRDGISHSPKEFAASDDIASGTKVLYETVLSIDSR